MATDFATGLGSGVAANFTNAIVGLLFQQLKDVRALGENLQLLNTELARMDESLRHIQNQFEDQQKKLPELLARCLERINDSLEEVKSLIHRATRQRGWCVGCCLFCNPKIPSEIRQWKIRFGELFQHLDSALSIATHTAQTVESAQPQAEVLLQPLPESGFVGSRIEDAKNQLLTWLNQAHPQPRVIGVYGMAGVGKTALLRLIYNDYKKEVRSNSIFDLVIWFTVCQEYKIEDLQASIADTLRLNLKEICNIDMRKMKLSSSLETKRFLLILDDIWSPINLSEVGVKFGDHKHSKVVISSRSREVVEIMAATNEYCIMIQPLSRDEGWELFRRRAVPDRNLEAIAREVALECKGLPLAINTVAAALARKKTADQWRRALDMMKNVDPSFPSTHSTIDAELYQRLRWSYNVLPDPNLKMCFLYCAAFPEDAQINVDTLVEMWTAERLVPQKGTIYFMDVGREYIDALVDRCLIEYVDTGKTKIKIHDVLRDMAIYVGQREENWLFLAGQHLQHFPSEEETTDCKRISVFDNEISILPTDFKKCPTLVTLVLARNRQLQEIPDRFWVKFMSLKVLDLSDTSIEALPTSVGQLGQLEFLNLNGCRKLKGLPDSICNLSHLLFLHLEGCDSLNYLPDKIGELKNLKHLIFSDRGQVKGIPHQISQLTSLNKLVLPEYSTPMSVDDLTSLSNLIELDVTVKPEIKRGSMSTWSDMRSLTLRFQGGNSEDAALDILPQNMQSMKKLQSLFLFAYRGVSLPDCICQFQYLKSLYLSYCMELKELPAFQNGNDAASGGFPMLEELELSDLSSLESIVWMERLPNLRELKISWCNHLKELFMDTDGGFPRLERLQLCGLERLESIAWNAKAMLQLQILDLAYCRVLKTFRMEELPNLRKLNISACDELFMGSGILESIAAPSTVWSGGTMPKLESLFIDQCLSLRRFTTEKFLNLKVIKITRCPQLEVEIGSLPMLEKLILRDLKKIQTIAILSTAWNEKTMAKLQIIKIINCPLLRRLPMEMDKLSNLREIVGKLDWWKEINWENDNVNIKLSQLLREVGKYEFDFM